MIIKSMARKEPTFNQLINYINKETNKTQTIIHNFYNQDLENIQEEFTRNSNHIKNSKGKNYLYHEIISLSPNQQHIKTKDLENILIDLGKKYIEKRAKNNLVYGKIHQEKNHIHLHLCISANEINSDKRLRLSKADFLKIQKELEIYKEQKYKNLEEATIYQKINQAQDYQEKEGFKYSTENPHAKDKGKISRREQELKQRTKSPTKRELIRESTLKIFKTSNTKEELLKNLKLNNFELYQRGRTIGVKDLKTNRNYRLKTLGINQEYQELKDKITQIEKRGIELSKLREAKEQKQKLKQNRNF